MGLNKKVKEHEQSIFKIAAMIEHMAQRIQEIEKKVSKLEGDESRKDK